MQISKYTEEFVRLCVEKYYKETHEDFKKVSTMADLDPDTLMNDLSEKNREVLFNGFNEINERVIKILFRIECCEDAEIPKAHAIANIIDKTIGSNYSNRRPSDDQIHEIVNSHEIIE
jgi:hypothetical protein